MLTLALIVESTRTCIFSLRRGSALSRAKASKWNTVSGRLERRRREINAVAPSLKRDPFGFIWVKVAIT